MPLRKFEKGHIWKVDVKEGLLNSIEGYASGLDDE